MVTVNGEQKDISGITLMEYLTAEGYAIDRIVVERNLEIVPLEQLGNVIIQDEDVIEILRFVGGG